MIKRMILIFHLQTFEYFILRQTGSKAAGKETYKNKIMYIARTFLVFSRV
jgi:hypothetical protein